MGACCSCQMGVRYRGDLSDDHGVKPKDSEAEDNDQIITIGDCGARVRLQGSTKFVSMFTRQGRKGTNQDAMTVWENFGGERDVVYCGVFDGHGPSGHKVARYVRDALPSKLSWLFRDSHVHGKSWSNQDHGSDQKVINLNDSNDPILRSWQASITESFKEVDEDLEADSSIDSYGSGTTSVSVLRQVLVFIEKLNLNYEHHHLVSHIMLFVGDNLLIMNLGDSRALLCTRSNDDKLHPVQLTNSGGRVQAMEHEPSVFRVWMPDQDCPGLAMSRAFGDFCLKDYGLICVPNIFYRKLTDEDEFVVLATDGVRSISKFYIIRLVWDVLTNNEVVKIVGSVKKRSMAARFLIDHAVRAWRYKYPASKIDDCAVVILFFKKQRLLLSKSSSEDLDLINSDHPDLDAIKNPKKTGDDGLDTVLNYHIKEDESKMRKAAKKIQLIEE
ncbi:Protein phosphatase 2C [Cynara cardunculus var. scolymus]|uniref:Protein phosphatase 2C n=1 Tax=Cynara cardunculus var. scolymus TaxID=59895 RepID=A0A103YLB7_CYNCS|nr:Protein phosphatase 2C [Cynara cardunculus var. scolymus]